MAKNTGRIAGRLGAEVIATVPDAVGGVFGAARLERIIAELQSRLVPGHDRRAGRAGSITHAGQGESSSCDVSRRGSKDPKAGFINARSESRCHPSDRCPDG